MIINVLVYVVELDVLLFEPKMRLIFHFQRIVRYDLLARLDLPIAPWPWLLQSYCPVTGTCWIHGYVLWPLYRLHPYVPWNPISLVQICWHNTASTSRHNTTSNEKYTMKFAVTTCLTILFGSLLHASVRVDGLQRSDNVSYYHMKACLTAKRARQRWEDTSRDYSVPWFRYKLD